MVDRDSAFHEAHLLSQKVYCGTRTCPAQVTVFISFVGVGETQLMELLVSAVVGFIKRLWILEIFKVVLHVYDCSLAMRLSTSVA